MAETVIIKHPDIPEGRQTADGPVGTAEVTREQYDVVWKPLGWQEVSNREAEKIQARSEAGAEGGRK